MYMRERVCVCVFACVSVCVGVHVCAVEDLEVVMFQKGACQHRPKYYFLRIVTRLLSAWQWERGYSTAESVGFCG